MGRLQLQKVMRYALTGRRDTGVAALSATGGVSLDGTCAVSLVMLLTAAGGISMPGTADASVEMAVAATGGIAMEGTCDVTTPAAIAATGGIVMAGTVDVNIGNALDTMTDAIDAASTYHSYYVMEDTYLTLSGSEITQADDITASGYDITPPGTGPTHAATSGPNSRGKAGFGGRLEEAAFLDIDGTRFSAYWIGAADPDDNPRRWWSIGPQFSNKPFAFINTSDNNVVTIDDDVAGEISASDTTAPDDGYDLFTFIMSSSGHTAKLNGTAFSTDFSGSGVLDQGTIVDLRVGGDAFADATEQMAILIIADGDTTSADTDIVDALETYYGSF